ncbi:MAG: hypothetical protein Q8Q11_03185 [bacterium]|nr:hypothetical protein [bacterium]MDZ4347732.1 hypothetical protein [Candidatus Binatia bacterium]
MTAKEKLVRVPVGNGKSVKGYLRGSLTKPLVVFVHGLTGDPNEHQFYNGARYLEKRGLSSFRYNLYESRPMRQATLKTHASDFDKVVGYFRKRTKRKVFAVGHSYGGATILLSKDKDLDGAVLWDPSYKAGKSLSSLLKYDKRLKAYRLVWEVESILGKRMVDVDLATPWEDLGKDVTFPLKVILAGRGGLRKSGRYAKNAQGKSTIETIKGASHGFQEDGVAEKLFASTTKWFKGIR